MRELRSREGSSAEGCFAQDGNCSEKIIRAHSVQNAVILEQLCINNHVYVVRLQRSGRAGFVLEGRNKTLTYTGFCTFHDHSIFDNIDFRSAGQFGPPSHRQSVLFHLRALGLERWTKSIRVRQFEDALRQEKTRPRNDRGLLLAQGMLRGLRLAHDELRREFLSCTLQLHFNRFDPTIAHYYSFPKIVRLATSLNCSLLFDIHGTPVVNLSGRVRPYPHLSLTIFPLHATTHVLICYHRRYRPYFAAFFQQFEAGSTEQQQIWLSKMLLGAYENIVFNPDYVDAMSPDYRDLIEGWMTHLYAKELPMPYIPNLNLFE
jgi:hypothetical protein